MRTYWIGVALVFLVLNGLVLRQERLLAQGRPVLLKLAPVDPRSLMQGDYMRLAYDLGRHPDPPATSGTLIARLDRDGVATFARYDDGTPLSPDEVRLRYTADGSRLQVASDAFFFQEGRADHFAAARYAEVQVSPDGITTLRALLAPDFRRL